MTGTSFSLSDLAATEQLAVKLSAYLQMSDVVALEGDLGAGKTTFARALMRAKGISGDVPSPTFTLLQSYDTPLYPISHFDLYRLKDEAELDELGWDDAVADSLVLVEWASRAASRLPRNRLELHFGMDTKGRRHCVIKPYGTWQKKWETITL